MVRIARAAAIALVLVSIWPATALADGGRLVVCDDVSEPATLNPLHEFDAKTHSILLQVYDGLLQIDAAGNVVAAVAEAWRRTSPLDLRLTLRAGVRFHDCSAVTARDVKASVDKYLDPATHFPARDLFASIASVTVHSDLDLTVHTHVPDGILERRLACLRILPHRLITEPNLKDLDRRPVGSGPFRFEAWTPGHSITLRANRDYWRPGQPELESLVFKFIPQKEQIRALLAGDVDLLTEVAGTDTLRVQREPEFSVKKMYCFSTYTASLNNQKLPFSSREARLALNLCVDREDLIRYEAMGNGRIIATMTMPGQFGHDASLKPYPYDPDKARAIFLKLQERQPFRIRALAKRQAERVATFVQGSLRRVGVEMDVSFVSAAEGIATRQEGSWDLYITSCPDPLCHASFVQSMAVFSLSPVGLCHDTHFDGLFGEALATIDPKEQRSRFEALDGYVYRECLGLFTYQKLTIFAHRKGLAFSPFISGMPCFAETHWMPRVP